MEKMLVISKDELMRATMKKVFETGLQVSVSDHKEALERFLKEEPDFVLILDYEEHTDFSGVRTYKDIKNSATNEMIFRCGFGKYDYEDYIQMPFLLDDVKKKFSK
jgi:CheY-like chemotaxis protein